MEFPVRQFAWDLGNNPPPCPPKLNTLGLPRSPNAKPIFISMGVVRQAVSRSAGRSGAVGNSSLTPHAPKMDQLALKIQPSTLFNSRNPCTNLPAQEQSRNDDRTGPSHPSINITDMHGNVLRVVLVEDPEFTIICGLGNTMTIVMK